ncbi:pilus assembly protein CpaF [Desulfohalotomaculum tongense]|uniref:CpaF family protein n=1 Tax=Desulforadius tongensis TaxID=1216062 RepID=UPI00195E762C|nr:ATPase, T2SS/T4P/T4SS family [Desulforadius tongensis]MBM7854941.1 pilus assembly protein CpaF [Desulforadius tongensis]
MFFKKNKKEAMSFGTEKRIEEKDAEETVNDSTLVRLGKKTLFEATQFVQELVSDIQTDIEIDGEDIHKILYLAKAGQPGYDLKARKVVESLLNKYGISVDGISTEKAAKEIYKYLWGLDRIEDLYRMEGIDEIRINSPKKVYYQEKGRNKTSTITFKDEEHIRKIISRLIEHDRTSLDEGNPGCESRRYDGTRITALGPPLTKGPCLALRRHGTFMTTDENYISSGTMDEYTLKLLSLLVKGRANILICGDANTGKTTLLRWLAKFINPALRIVTIETDRELELDEWYPERDIISLEVHSELGWDMGRCFYVTLRLSPDLIIVGEARGLGESGQLIKACQRGHNGSMGTIHCDSARKAVSILAQMALEEGSRLPVKILEQQIAQSFNVIIQLYGNSDTGIRKIEHIAEVWDGENGPEYSDLIMWEPSDEKYEIGRWVYPQGLSKNLKRKLFKYGVSKKELDGLEMLRRQLTN